MDTPVLMDTPDWSDYPDLSFIDRCNRSSQSVVQIYPSASSLSDIGSFSRYNLVYFGGAVQLPEIENPYEIQSFVRIVADPYQDSVEEESSMEEESAAEEESATEEESAEAEVAAGAGAVVKDSRYMGKKLHKTIRNWMFVDIVWGISRDLVTKSESKLSQNRSQIPFETSTRKLPDVGVFNSKECILQIEVDSGGYVKTCRKLVFGMIDQLILQRNKSDDIMTCEGLYFPKAYVRSSVVKFEVTWSDSELRFTVDSKPLLQSDVILTTKRDAKE